MTAADQVVVIWRSLLLPGSETFIRNQADALTRWRPAFLGALKFDSVIARDTDVTAYPNSAGGRRAFLRLRALGRSSRVHHLLAGMRPGLVHAHFGGDGWLISRSAVRLGVPLVITLHGQDVTRQANARGARGFRYRRNLRSAFSRAALVLAVSEHIRQRAIELGADPAKVRVHHIGVPAPTAPAAAAAAAAAAAEKEWDVVFVGRFVEKKGIDDLVEALGQLDGVRALFIGSGPMEATVRGRAAALGLDATFLGAQDPAAVSRSLAAAHVFASPSKTAANGDAEGLPTTILEAQRLGVPVVSTYHGGIPEAVSHGETGLLVAEGDPAGLADCIRRLLADEQLRVRLGSQARRNAEAHFDLATQTRLLEDLYESVMSQRFSS
ncbi:glycosyltransferase involved in cell wall biosynthesis [Asanoa ferruginea]|uniref:Glycosyltransferase involved in cell wall biosynthesis n=1 Tax=Asanoa ferruginea TaxID=53367 RepID=A0A3D9ZG30_9ACTN|nr:glycosyltransferase [Asanoa ferruginea]REF96378.1 glycosyltransferase involved in cell wall biosynthesis [Asanoa ferruginea]GIF47024.1 glycosyl transferase family 1 [Asanoa ferruginea]